MPSAGPSLIRSASALIAGRLPMIVGTGAEVTPVSEIGPHPFVPGAISRALIEAYTDEVQPKVAEEAYDL